MTYGTITIGPDSEVAFWRRKGIVVKPETQAQVMERMERESRRKARRTDYIYYIEMPKKQK